MNIEKTHSYFSNSEKEDIHYYNNRNRDFIKILLKYPHQYQKEFLSQFFLLLGVKPNKSYLTGSTEHLLKTFLQSTDDSFTNELLFWHFIITTRRNPVFFPQFTPTLEDIESIDQKSLVRVMEILHCVC